LEESKLSLFCCMQTDCIANLLTKLATSMIPSSTGCVQSIWNRRVVFFFLPLPDCCLAGRLLPFVCKEFKCNLVWVLHPVNQYSYNMCIRVRHTSQYTINTKHNHHSSHDTSSSLETLPVMPKLISATGSYWNGHIPVAISNFSGKFIRSFVHWNCRSNNANGSRVLSWRHD